MTRRIMITPAIPGYSPEVGMALWRLEDSRRRTLAFLDEMPAEYVNRDYQGNTIGTILYHLALVEADWLYVEVLEQGAVPDDLNDLFPEEMRDEQGMLTLRGSETLQQHLARLGAMRGILLDTFRGLTAEEFHRPRELPQYAVSPAWVLHHLSQHEAEHRGEMGSIIASFKQ